jgi:hypothetical protein
MIDLDAIERRLDDTKDWGLHYKHQQYDRVEKALKEVVPWDVSLSLGEVDAEIDPDNSHGETALAAGQRILQLRDDAAALLTEVHRLRALLEPTDWQKFAGKLFRGELTLADAGIGEE